MNVAKSKTTKAKAPKADDPISLERSLMFATGVKMTKNEDRQEFLARLAKAGQKLDEAQWNNLSEQTCDWINEANKAKAGQIAEPDVDEDAPGAGAADEKPVKKAKAAKQAKANSGGVKKAARVLEVFWRDLGQKPEDVAKVLEKEDGDRASDSTISVMRSSFFRDIKFLIAQGVVAKKYAPPSGRSKPTPKKKNRPPVGE